MDPAEYVKEAGFALTAIFQPASIQTDEWKRSAVNFQVTLTYNGIVCFQGSYAYGIGNLPGYKHNFGRKTVDEAHAEKQAIEDGLWSGRYGKRTTFDRKKVPDPKVTDVLYSILMDADVLNYGAFEEWADSLGYDADSRAAEETYKACLNQSLKFQSVVSNDIREALAVVIVTGKHYTGS